MLISKPVLTARPSQSGLQREAGLAAKSPAKRGPRGAEILRLAGEAGAAETCFRPAQRSRQAEKGPRRRTERLRPKTAKAASRCRTGERRAPHGRSPRYPQRPPFQGGTRAARGRPKTFAPKTFAPGRKRRKARPARPRRSGLAAKVGRRRQACRSQGFKPRGEGRPYGDKPAGAKEFKRAARSDLRRQDRRSQGVQTAQRGWTYATRRRAKDFKRAAKAAPTVQACGARNSSRAARSDLRRQDRRSQGIQAAQRGPLLRRQARWREASGRSPGGGKSFGGKPSGGRPSGGKPSGPRKPRSA